MMEIENKRLQLIIENQKEDLIILKEKSREGSLTAIRK